jgi:TolA-binding protein
MRSDLATSYAVDVESDSTMVQDDSATQEQVMQFTQAWTGYCTALLPLVKHDIMPADLFKEGLMLIKDAYKSGRQLEQTINALPSTLVQLQGLQSQTEQQAQQMQQLQQQNQKLQEALQQSGAQKLQNETVKTGADAQNKQANTEKQQAEAHILGAEAAKKEAEAHQTQRANIIEGLATGIQ